MPVDLNNYVPSYLVVPADTPSRHVVTAQEWNELWRLNAIQGNNTAEALYTLIEQLLSPTAGASGAKFIRATTIAGLAGVSVQDLLESLKNYIDTHKTSSDHDSRYFTETELGAVADGAAGADRIGATPLININGTTVQSILEALKNYIDTHKTSADHDNQYMIKDALSSSQDGSSGADAVGATPVYEGAGETVQANLESIYAQIVATTLGQIPDGSLANNKLAHDIKVGSLASLTTSNKTSVTAALNELNSKFSNYTHLVPFGGTTSGSANAYTVVAPPISILITGMAVSAIVHQANTDDCTLNWSNTGPKPIVKPGGGRPNLKAGGLYTFRYDGVNFQLQGEGAHGNATASDLLSGKTATTDAGEITGTIPSRGAATITPGTANQVIASGQYLSGAQTILGDPDLISDNIKAGKSIFNVTGKSSVVDTADATASAAYILTGKSGYVNGIKINGTMSNRSGSTIGDSGASAKTSSDAICTGTAYNSYVGAFDIKIPNGYYNGTTASRIHIPDLIPSNIKEGVNVGWSTHYITGTCKPAPEITPGEVVLLDLGTARITNPGFRERAFSIRVRFGGTYRISFKIHTADQSSRRCELKIGDVTVWNTYLAYGTVINEDVTIPENSTVSLIVHGSESTYVQNIQLKASAAFFTYSKFTSS